MKELINDVKFNKEYDSKFGKMYSFKVTYNGRTAYYSSKSKDQNNFIAGQEAEFTEETRTTDNGTYLIVKPIRGTKQSNFGKALKREQSKYSGFAMAYSKDLVVAGKIELDQMYSEAQCMMDWMVEADKQLES